MVVRRNSTSSDAEDDTLRAKFDFSEGTGIPMGQLPAVQAVGNRGAARKQLELRLEPLHRIIFGRSGWTGKRRQVLETFCGFPPAMQEEVNNRLHGLKKSKLRDLIQALGIPVQISKSHAQVADGVAAFLMQPHVVDSKRPPTGITQPSTKTAKKRQRASSPGDEAPEQPAKKAAGEEKSEEVRQTKEVPVAGGMAAASSAVPPSDDAIRVAVYKWLLASPREERANLSIKVVRLALQRSFGELYGRKKVIKEAVLECVEALARVEVAAAAAAAAAAATCNTSSNDETEVVESSPAPQRPHSLEALPLPSSSTTTTTRSHAPPPPESSDGSVALHSLLLPCAVDQPPPPVAAAAAAAAAAASTAAAVPAASIPSCLLPNAPVV